MNKWIKNFLKGFGLLSAVTLAAGFIFSGKKGGSIKSADNRFTYLILKNWENIHGELNPAAVIELADKDNIAYIVGIPYAKGNFSGLEDFHKHGIAQLNQAYQTFDRIETQYPLINGQEALLDKGTLIFDEVDYDFHLYSIEYSDIYLFLMAWTLCEHANYVFPEIEKIIYSIKRV